MNVSQDSSTSPFIAALISLTRGSDEPIEGYLIQIAKADGSVVSTHPVSLSVEEAPAIFRDAGLGPVKDLTRLSDGSFRVTYKGSIQDGDDGEFVSQLRYHGSITSMNTILHNIRQKIPKNLPVPRVFDVPVKSRCGLSVQISEFVPGRDAFDAYYGLDLQDRVRIVQQIARAFDALWNIPLQRLCTRDAIGEAIMESSQSHPSQIVVAVGRDRQNNIGGPFESATDYLKAWITHRLAALRAQREIDEYKERLLPQIESFVEKKLYTIPSVVDQVPIVLQHTDMGLHNMILSDDDPAKLRAVIDWEFTYLAPFPTALPRLIEPLFRRDADVSTIQDPWDGADTLSDAFWWAIPDWKQRMETRAAQLFLSWYEFGLFLKADAVPGRSAEDGDKFWRDNVVKVEQFLQRHLCETLIE
ncbi:hypothetical protein QQX98_007468 [Neonectria punicea]|uniref:Aminoglycoside phosphotransferase domain-containing protein n=1 Tax=Neonectria punicea TaxID=979145 RepID=A0ABR1GZ84_9HYPO